MNESPVGSITSKVLPTPITGLDGNAHVGLDPLNLYSFVVGQDFNRNGPVDPPVLKNTPQFVSFVSGGHPLVALAQDRTEQVSCLAAILNRQKIA